MNNEKWENLIKNLWSMVKEVKEELNILNKKIIEKEKSKVFRNLCKLLQIKKLQSTKCITHKAILWKEYILH